MGRLLSLRRMVACALAAAVVAVIAVWATRPAAAPAHRAVASSGASFLYVLQAKEGWATRRPNGHWRLSLRGVSLFEFTDRPVRRAASVSADFFVANFKRIFGATPPNAAFVVAHAPAGTQPTAVELLKAFWEKPGQLALCMCTIGKQPGAVRWLSQLTRATALRHGQITMFIDNATCCVIKYAANRRRRTTGSR